MTEERAEFGPFREKMEEAGQSGAAIDAFERSYDWLCRGVSGLVDEGEIEPVEELPEYGAVVSGGVESEGEAPVGETVVIKLNGGLGTGMGLERAKSLLEVREGLTFLDLIARQVKWWRGRSGEGEGEGLRFLLMNSYATSGDTLEFFEERYSELGGGKEMELMQSQVPKVDAATMAPVEYGERPELEWCPPGHGDLYASLLGTGWLDLLLAQGVRYAFVSNSDNLGATLDEGLLGYFASSGAPFLMEVTRRTPSDSKGGHLAVEAGSGRLILRESAQCSEEDRAAFQDIERHRFFNTNNLWLRLDVLKEVLDASGGAIPLPVMKNEKTVNPRDGGSARVYQLETAMGAAIGCFEGAGALVVPRSRFAPVKSTSDLFSVRSDAYELTEDARLVLAASRGGTPPEVVLDGAHYKMVDQLEAATREGVPSMIGCDRLEVVGPVEFYGDGVVEGRVLISNEGEEAKRVPAGVLRDGEYVL
ncbi:MAG: UTP--glucose-1-phosphate uridylyltransferase [Verrucomicrobiota bacterium]